jgi:hypothetical protein
MSPKPMIGQRDDREFYHRRRWERSERSEISLTDPDARAMATSGRGSGMVGYNVQSAVDTKHHLIVTHEVTNVGSDRSQLSRMSEQARAAIGSEAIEAVADHGTIAARKLLPVSKPASLSIVLGRCTLPSEGDTKGVTIRGFLALSKTISPYFREPYGRDGPLSIMVPDRNSQAV